MAMRRFAGGTWVTSTPPMKIVPSVTTSRPAIMRKKGRLAAAGRPEQGAELAAVDGQVDILDRLDGPETLFDAAQFDFDHLTPQSVGVYLSRRFAAPLVPQVSGIHTIIRPGPRLFHK